MLCYILITYRRKDSQSLRDHPQAKAQIDYYKGTMSGDQGKSAKYVSDIARRISGLASLPKLSFVLSRMREQDRGKILFRDLTLLFRYTELTKRAEFFAELAEFDVHIYSLRHTKALSEFSQKEIHDLIVHPDGAKFPTRRGTTRKMDKARGSSRAARTAKSIAVARQIKDVRNELIDREGRATLQMVADEANARGMRTTRGSKWTAPNVGRILDLLERSEQEE